MSACLSDLLAAGFTAHEATGTTVYREEASYATLTEYLAYAEDLITNGIGVIVQSTAKAPVKDVANFLAFTRNLIGRGDLLGSGSVRLLYAPDVTAEGSKALTSKLFKELATSHKVLCVYGLSDGFNETSADVFSSLVRRRKAAGLTTNMLLEECVVQPSHRELFKQFVQLLISVNEVPHNPNEAS